MLSTYTNKKANPSKQAFFTNIYMFSPLVLKIFYIHEKNHVFGGVKRIFPPKWDIFCKKKLINVGSDLLEHHPAVLPHDLELDIEGKGVGIFLVKRGKVVLDQLDCPVEHVDFATVED